jgi:solute carrier family 25 protein 34/35
VRLISACKANGVENTVKDPVTGKVRGLLYKGPIDCLWKTFKAEGIAGWYKGKLGLKPAGQRLTAPAGTTAHFFRIFPHTVVTLVANEASPSIHLSL